MTVAELVKRRFRALHQLNRITQKEVIELWDPKLPDLETLKVTRQIPAITIVLSENQVLESLPQVGQIPEAMLFVSFWVFFPFTSSEWAFSNFFNNCLFYFRLPIF